MALELKNHDFSTFSNESISLPYSKRIQTEPLQSKKGDFALSEEENSRHSIKNTIKKNGCFIFLKFVFKEVLFSHIVVNLLIFLKISIQDYYAKYCWISPNCSCDNQTIPKLYSIINETMFYWLLIIYFILNSTFQYNQFLDKRFPQILYIILNFFLIITYFMVIPEEKSQNLVVYFFMLFSSLLFHLYYWIVLSTLKLQSFLKNMFKFNGVTTFIFTNYLILRYSYFPLKDFWYGISDQGVFYFQIITLIYFQIFTISIKKLLFIYDKFSRLQKDDAYEPTLIMIRISLSHIMSINTGTLVKIDELDSTNWLIILFHIHFICSFYTRIDIFTFFF